MRISIVFSCHNRGTYLRLALTSLIRQTRLPDEVIVIDDCSSTPIAPHIEDAVRRLRAMGVETVVLRSRRELGLGAARGVGARLSRGDAVVFLDDDVVASRTLVEEYEKAFERGCDIVAGSVHPLYMPRGIELPRWWDERVLGGMVAVRNDIAFARARTPADYVYGCNFGVQKRVLESVRGFKPWLGRVGGTLLSGEEWDLVARALARGFRVCFAPRAAVLHVVPPTKISVARVLRMARGTAWTRCVLAYEGSFLHGLRSMLLRYAASIPLDAVRILGFAALGRGSQAMKAFMDLLTHLYAVSECITVLKRVWVQRHS